MDDFRQITKALFSELFRLFCLCRGDNHFWIQSVSQRKYIHQVLNRKWIIKTQHNKCIRRTSKFFFKLRFKRIKWNLGVVYKINFFFGHCQVNLLLLKCLTASRIGQWNFNHARIEQRGSNDEEQHKKEHDVVHRRGKYFSSEVFFLMKVYHFDGLFNRSMKFIAFHSSWWIALFKIILSQWYPI